ncbi:MAG TPA: hypothetical protein DCP91_11495 [Eggerthellaceae bacterium]|nr:hypothetical protein [Eggerthellaceae bacterium]
MQKFLETMADIFEVDVEDLDMSVPFRDVEAYDFDSLKGFAIICAFEEEYGKEVSVDTFLECKTLADLYALTGLEG